MNDISIERLLNICGYGVHINIKLSDNGKIAINGVSCLKNSKDKRQAAKWEAFKNTHVYGISPTVDMSYVKRHGDVIVLCINAYVHRQDYDAAMCRYEELLGGNKNDGE